ncbi:TPA: hypothetical protein DEO28_01515 [Candidatus Dependentiae bacterium]|nr:MAG: HEPN domain protein [candidate division TM6 bacterium GW2011_GWE2_31_21]KKP53686.1 MAG: HEPN domain protein [candidate division TM6 bacterium GW2011_GWF2_33_332]HBS48562.1 hypothetical protein [Candidatus Dependentiae bacterium]HBZ73177.1 hypothetical protein [Candidatus Dependentiae bacterium]
MQEHERWINVAKEDLKVAKCLLPEELFSSVTYHCQQSAEKSLKGYLAFKKHEIIKTHDLTKLVGLCKFFDREFESIFSLAEQLNPFATRFRYPTEFDIPTQEDCEFAIKQSEKIMKFVLKKILETETSQMDIF